MDIIDNAADYPKSQSQLEKQLGLTAASLNSAITKGWLNKKVLRFIAIRYPDLMTENIKQRLP